MNKQKNVAETLGERPKPNEKKVYKRKTRYTTQLSRNVSVEGESIEQRMERLLSNGDEVGEMKEEIYSRQEDGVNGNFDIRHDHWDDAVEQASIMAEKNAELDGKKLEKRKEALKQQQEEEKLMRTEAKEKLKLKNNGDGANLPD